MNNAVLVGNLTKDIELKYTQDGKAVANFTLAVARRFNRDQTDFIRIVAFGKQAENCGKYLRKGSKCGVVGSIQTGSYTDKNGITRYTTDIFANEVEFLSPSSKQAEPVGVVEDVDISDDEIPF